MKKIAQLSDFIISLGAVSANQIQSYVDLIQMTAAGRLETCGSSRIIIADCRYNATYYMSGYPFRRYPIELLTAQLSAWLLQHDAERKDPAEITINVDVLDEDGRQGNLANLEFTVLFDESIVITPDVNGFITYNNGTYNIYE